MLLCCGFTFFFFFLSSFFFFLSSFFLSFFCTVTRRTSLLQVMVCDPYANYVVQKIIDVADQEQRQTIIMEIKAHAAQLKRYTFGKHIISRLEKLSGKKM